MAVVDASPIVYYSRIGELYWLLAFYRSLKTTGVVDWGIFYPLAIIPIGIVGAANAYNMLAGYSGLEAWIVYHKRPGDPGADDRQDYGKDPYGGRKNDEDTTDAC